MADINSRPGLPTELAPSRPNSTVNVKRACEGAREDLTDLVELLFFAYREFTAEPDAVLARYGFGRAHHRVLHFVNRSPGLRVADLLDILKITKQSLARVLKQLVERGFIESQAGETDRRERLLFLTPRGTELAKQLMDLQNARLDRALQSAGPGAEMAARAFLLGIVGDAETTGFDGRYESQVFESDEHNE